MIFNGEIIGSFLPPYSRIYLYVYFRIKYFLRYIFDDEKQNQDNYYVIYLWKHTINSLPDHSQLALYSDITNIQFFYRFSLCWLSEATPNNNVFLCHSDKDCYVGTFQRFPMFITPEIAGDRVDVGTRIYLHCHEGYFLRCAGSLLCLESGRMEGLGMMCQCDREFLYN